MKIGLRGILFVALLLAIPVGSWWFVFRPANDQHTKLREEVEAKQEKLNKLNRLVGKVGSLQDEIAALEKAVAFFQSKLPKEKEIDKVLRGTWQLAERNRLVTKSIRTVNQTSEAARMFASGSQYEQPIHIELTGNFAGFYTFLQALEDQARIMRISRMELARPTGGKKGHIEASLDMYVFFDMSEGE